MPMPLRILVVDDSDVTRQMLVRIINSYSQWTVCGAFSDAASGIEQVKLLKPDLVLMDFHMRGMNGIEAARRLSKFAPAIPIIMFSLFVSSSLLAVAPTVGVIKVISKSDFPELLEAIKAVEAIKSLGAHRTKKAKSASPLAKTRSRVTDSCNPKWQ